MRFPTCSVYQNVFPHISYTYHAEDRAEFCTNECVENFALSYRFPTCTKSKFSFCATGVKCSEDLQYYQSQTKHVLEQSRAVTLMSMCT